MGDVELKDEHASSTANILTSTDVNQRERYSILGYAPDWLQRFRSPKTFLLLSVFGALLSGMSAAGWDSSMTSIERRFKMPFGLLGTIRALSQVGGLVVMPLVAHYGGAGHRPKWIGATFLWSAIGTAIVIAPEFLTQTPHGDYADSDRSFDISNATLAARLHLSQSGICVAGEDIGCDVDAEPVAFQGWSTGVFLAFVVGHTLIDSAMVSGHILVMPYYHDNVKMKNFPIYLGICSASFYVGLAAGQGSMSFFSDIYYRPWSTPPGVAPGDPQWIGAWYLPMAIAAIGQVILAAFSLGFPRQVRYASRAEVEAAAKQRRDDGYAQPGSQAVLRREARFGQMPRDYWRLLSNRIFFFLAIGRGLDMVTIMSKIAQVKYLENQFRMTPARAAAYLSGLGLSVSAVSFLTGSLIIKFLRPSPRTIMLMIWGSQLATIGLTSLKAHIECDTQAVLIGQSLDDVAIFNFNATCNAHCQCSDERFEPVCDHSLNVNYFSPCRAGCSSPGETGADDPSQLYFSDCACVEGGRVQRGWCEGECSAGFLYVLINAINVLISNFPLAGNTIILYLVIEPELKSHSMAVISIFQTVLMPGAVILTMIFDTACVRWVGEGGRCTDASESGNCLVYDLAVLRLAYHYFGVFVQLLGELSDTYVLYAVWNMSFPKKPPKKSSEKLQREESTDS